MFLRRLWQHALRITLTVLVAGFLGTALVRLAPAFGISENELDPRLSGAAQASATSSQPGVFAYYGRFLAGLAHGDLGQSPSLERPISELVRERLPISLRSLAVGTGAGLAIGFALALISALFESAWARRVPVMFSTMLLALPSAALALLFLLAGWPPGAALAAIIAPKVYRTARAAIGRSLEAPHVLGARARGVARWRVVAFHVVPPVAPQLLAVAGMAVSIGFPALVPIEAACDSPGMLQLAIKAAFARDLPLLVMLTMIASVVVMIGNAAADLAAGHMERCA